MHPLDRMEMAGSAVGAAAGSSRGRSHSRRDRSRSRSKEKRKGEHSKGRSRDREARSARKRSRSRTTGKKERKHKRKDSSSSSSRSRSRSRGRSKRSRRRQSSGRRSRSRGTGKRGGSSKAVEAGPKRETSRRRAKAKSDKEERIAKPATGVQEEEEVPGFQKGQEMGGVEQKSRSGAGVGLVEVKQQSNHEQEGAYGLQGSHGAHRGADGGDGGAVGGMGVSLVTQEDDVSSVTGGSSSSGVASDDSYTISGGSSADSRSRSRRRSRGRSRKQDRKGRRSSPSSSSSSRSSSRSRSRSRHHHRRHRSGNRGRSYGRYEVERARDSLHVRSKSPGVGRSSWQGLGPLRLIADGFRGRPPSEGGPLHPTLEEELLKHVRKCVLTVRGGEPTNMGEIGNALPRAVKLAQVSCLGSLQGTYQFGTVLDEPGRARMAWVVIPESCRRRTFGSPTLCSFGASSSSCVAGRYWPQPSQWHHIHTSFLLHIANLWLEHGVLD